MGAQAGGEGMLRGGQAHVVPVQPQQVHQPVGQTLLFHRAEAAPEHGVVRQGLFPHPLQQRDHPPTHRVEEGVAEGPVQALLVAVQPIVVGVLLRRAIAGDPHRRVKAFAQTGGKGGEVAAHLGLAPHGVGLDPQLAVGDVFRLGDVPQPVRLLAEEVRHPPLPLRQLRPICVQLLQQPGRLRPGVDPIQRLAEHGHGAGTVAGCAPGRRGGPVVEQQAQGVVIGRQGLLQRVQGAAALLQRHDGSLPVFSDDIIAGDRADDKNAGPEKSIVRRGFLV